MNLPNYFLADLPPEAQLTGAMISEACQTLKRNRERYLRGRTTASLIRALTDVAASWLKPEFPFRRFALAAGPDQTGFSSPTLAAGLDAFFAEVTPENLERLLVQDLGHVRRLDELCGPRMELDAGRLGLAKGPELLATIAAGNLPAPVLSSVLLGVLTRSAQFVKCASGAAFLPRLFAHSLYESDPKLGACLELAEWVGGRAELESALFHEADCVTATGTDETLAALRRVVPASVRFLGYGHRVSFGYIAGESLDAGRIWRVATRAAADVVAWDQLGCLSPHLFYVDQSGQVSADDFAHVLAEHLAQREVDQPRGPISAETAAAIANRRAFYEVRAAHAGDARLWASPGSTAWTVVCEAEPLFQVSCLHRFVYVKPVASCEAALRAADAVRGSVSTVGLEAPDHRMAELAGAFARWGAGRVCPLGQMQKPPLTWRHDGRPSLGDLVTWTDWERPED